jgi:hypothetical protein
VVTLDLIEDYAKPGRIRNRRTLVLDIEKPGDTPD